MSRTVIPPGVHAQDLLVEAGEPRLALAHQLRLERPFPISGHLDLHRALLGLEGLGAGPVPGVRQPPAFGVVLLIAEVVGHLGVQGPLHQARRQLLQDAVLAG
jgi:hypothetical protein